MLKAVEAGACGYISKDTGPDELVAAIRRAADGEFLLPAATMSRLLSRQREVRQQELEQQRLLDELTPREQQILSLLATGANNRAIAAQLGIAYGTVRTHVRSLLEKLESSSRLQAVSTARERRQPFPGNRHAPAGERRPSRCRGGPAPSWESAPAPSRPEDRGATSDSVADRP